MRKSVFVRVMSAFVSGLTCFLLLFCGFAVSAEAAGKSGWVEVRVVVPEGFQENIIATFVNKDTFEEYSTRVLAANGYVSSFQVPLGDYQFDGAFLENSDFRYNTVLTNDAANFTVSADAEKAVLLTLETIYNDAFSSGAEASAPANPDHSEPVDSQAEDSVEPSSGTDSASDPITEEIFEPVEEVEATEEAKGSLLISSEENPSLSVVERLLYGLISTGVFILVVIMGVFLYRKHIDSN